MSDFEIAKIWIGCQFMFLAGLTLLVWLDLRNRK